MTSPVIITTTAAANASVKDASASPALLLVRLLPPLLSLQASLSLAQVAAVDDLFVIDAGQFAHRTLDVFNTTEACRRSSYTHGLRALSRCQAQVRWCCSTRCLVRPSRRC